MKRRRSNLAGLPAFALAMQLGLGCGPAGEPAVNAPRQLGADDPVITVDTARIRRGSIVQRISAPGSIVARRKSHVGPDMRGRVDQIFVDEGDHVEQGDPLFQIDREPYELALRRAKASLDRAKAERRQTERDLSRGQALEDKNIVSAEATDRIETGLEVARAVEREAAEAVAMARRNLDRTLVLAPFEGSVTRRLLDEGTTALVQPQTIVIVLEETGVLEAIATIAEIHFAAVAPGDVAFLHIFGLPTPIRTKIDAVSDSIDPVTRTYRVRMLLPNPGRDLKAGLFAKVEILPRAKSEVVLAPREALRFQDGSTYVLMVRDGRAVMSPIEIGLISEDAVEVLAGLRVDDQVVVGDAARTLGPGMLVEVRNRVGSEGS
jgi:membrane fusion protein (multidrug efflux system)